MKNLTHKETMSSREIADLTEKEHKNVIRDCDIMNENYENLGLLKIEQGYYFHPNTGKQQHREYLLTKIQTLDLMTGYNTELRIKVNRRWEELEQKQHAIPQSYSEALMLASRQAEQLELQQRELEIQAPKAEYFDTVLQSRSTYTTTQIAKELGMSATDLNKKLFQIKVQYKQSSQWMLYAKYQDKGFTKTTTHSYTNSLGQTQTSMLTVWTEKGREFIHKTLVDKIVNNKKQLLW